MTECTPTLITSIPPSPLSIYRIRDSPTTTLYQIVEIKFLPFIEEDVFYPTGIQFTSLAYYWNDSKNAFVPSFDSWGVGTAYSPEHFHHIFSLVPVVVLQPDETVSMYIKDEVQ